MMLRERIVPQSEVISAILLEDSAYCGVPHLPEAEWADEPVQPDRVRHPAV